MNCDDISRILDGDDVASGEARQRALAAHLAGCPDCMRDWAIHLQLANASGPAPSPDLVARCRTLVTARLAGGTRRTANRFVLPGVVLVVAAAAAMLAGRLLERPAQHVAATAPSAVSGSAAAETLEALPPAEPVAVPEPGEASSKEKQKKTAAKPFVVHLPLLNKATTADARIAIDAFYATLRDGLDSIDGLTLVEQEVVDGAPGQPVEFRIRVTGEGPGPDAESRLNFRVSVQGEQLGPDGKAAGQFNRYSAGSILAGCSPAAIADLSCADPQTLAESTLTALRIYLLPPDPSLRLELQARVLNPALSTRQRMRALGDLQSVRNVAAPGASPKRGGALQDPAVVEGVVKMVSMANPDQRMEVWRIMRGVGMKALVDPLIASARQDVESDVRVEAVSTLAADYLDDDRTRPALEAIDREEVRPLVRALARRGLLGDAAWQAYIADSLKDVNRSASERVEALLYAMNVPLRIEYGSFVPNAGPLLKLDADALQAVAEALPEAAAGSPTVQRFSTTVGSVLASRDHPAITRMLLEALQSQPSWLDRGVAVRGLVRRIADPQVRAALQAVSEADANLQLRQIASDALKNVPAAPASTTNN